MTTSQHQSGNGSVSQNSVSGAISRVSGTQTSVYPHRRNSTQFSHGSAYKSVFLRGHTNISFFYAGILQQDATEPRPRTQTLAYLPSRNSTQSRFPRVVRATFARPRISWLHPGSSQDFEAASSSAHLAVVLR